MVKKVFIFFVLLVIMVWEGLRAQGLTQETFKIGKTLALLEAIYVDSVNISAITEDMITGALRNLDPHSVYIPAKDVQEENEQLQGNFEGIGIQFNLLNDTIIIISPIPGGPSERLGIQAGDRIVTIAGEKVTGTGITTTGVQKRLRGPKGTKVEVTIFRKGEKELLDFTITRDKIPVNTLDAAYMVSDNIGYIKLSRFAEQTAREFSEAVERLRASRMEHLVIDLRGNSGGYMVPAVQIADELLSGDELIVYLEGLHTSRQEYKSAPSGALTRAVMFFSLADAPSVERLLTPRVALTMAEHLAFDCGQHVLVLLTDMTNYCESLREVGTARGEIPGRKGYPGYLYSDLAGIYERAGRIEGSSGSITQMAILTMPSDDISHPVPDLTGYITEGQIVLDRDLFNRGVYPPIAGLPSLSRLMKDGVGRGYTRDDHPALASQMFACYARVKRVRGLADVIGEEELSALDKQYLKFGEALEHRFLTQGEYENRGIAATLDLGWEILSTLPRDELHRVSDQLLAEHYRPQASAAPGTPAAPAAQAHEPGGR